MIIVLLLLLLLLSPRLLLRSVVVCTRVAAATAEPHELCWMCRKRCLVVREMWQIKIRKALRSSCYIRWFQLGWLGHESSSATAYSRRPMTEIAQEVNFFSFLLGYYCLCFWGLVRSFDTKWRGFDRRIRNNYVILCFLLFVTYLSLTNCFLTKSDL